MLAHNLFVGLWLLAAVCATTARGADDSDVRVNPFRLTKAPTDELRDFEFGDFELAGAELEEVDRPLALDASQNSMQQLGVDINLPSGKLPEDVAPPVALPLAGDLPRPWPAQVYHWQAAATRHQPLYFEEINAERYGYSCNWVAQPFVSTAHFFGTLPALPYLMAANCPWECQYTLGHYRAGSCPPSRFHCWPVDCVGATAEVGTLAWLIFVLP